MQLDSIPIVLDVEADKTNVTIKNLKRNPKKFSFGKILFKDSVLEACIYPLKTLDSVLWFLRTQGWQKGRFVTDIRKVKEVHALIMRVRYYLRLTRKRKLEYLWKKGFFANINTIGSTLTVPEKHKLRRYEEIILDP